MTIRHSRQASVCSDSITSRHFLLKYK